MPLKRGTWSKLNANSTNFTVDAKLEHDFSHRPPNKQKLNYWCRIWAIGAVDKMEEKDRVLNKVGRLSLVPARAIEGSWQLINRTWDWWSSQRAHCSSLTHTHKIILQRWSCVDLKSLSTHSQFLSMQANDNEFATNMFFLEREAEGSWTIWRQLIRRSQQWKHVNIISVSDCISVSSAPAFAAYFMNLHYAHKKSKANQTTTKKRKLQ